MTKKLKVYLSDSFDPWFNIATEDWLFKDHDPSYQILFLWRNSDTVVIGRFQNPWRECNVEKMQTDGIKLARRHSGGGAVYQDLGNSIFTFLSPKNDYSKERNNRIIINALNEFKVEAEATGRNDIVVDGKKISGSAFKERHDRAFHHGTLLINANLDKLAHYLTPKPKKLQAKGITSVKSRVMNLNEINPQISHQNICEKIIQSFFKEYNSTCEIEFLEQEKLKSIPFLQQSYERLSDWNWRFGETPQFDHMLEEQFAWGGMEVHLNVLEAKIDDLKIFSDSLHPEMVELVMGCLKGVSYSEDGIDQAIEKAKSELPMVADYLEEFSIWLKSELK